MLITDQSLNNMFTGFSALFNKGLGAAPSHWRKIAMEVPSQTSEETYGWIGRFPQMREWLAKGVGAIVTATAQLVGLLGKTVEFAEQLSKVPGTGPWFSARAGELMNGFSTGKFPGWADPLGVWSSRQTKPTAPMRAPRELRGNRPSGDTISRGARNGPPPAPKREKASLEIILKGDGAKQASVGRIDAPDNTRITVTRGRAMGMPA